MPIIELILLMIPWLGLLWLCGTVADTLLRELPSIFSAPDVDLDPH